MQIAMERTSLMVALMLASAPASADEKGTVYRNAIAAAPPLPGIVVLEYERFFDSAPRTIASCERRLLLSAGLSLGLGYETKYALGSDTKSLYSEEVDFETLS